MLVNVTRIAYKKLILLFAKLSLISPSSSLVKPGCLLTASLHSQTLFLYSDIACKQIFFRNQQPISANPPGFHKDILPSCVLYISGYDENNLIGDHHG